MPYTHNAPVRVVIADDHPTFRDGLTRLLETDGDLHVVGSAGDGEEATRLVEQLEPDLLLLDVAMPRKPGLVALRELRERSVRARIILVTAALDRDELISGLQLGAQGIVLKESASEVLFKSIHAAVACQSWFGRNRVADPTTALQQLLASHPQPSRKHFGLTPRELEIISVILGGYSNGEIATKFSISEKTVKHHLTNIFDKLGVSNRLELALFAVHHKIGLTPVPVAAPAAAQAPVQPSAPTKQTATLV
ncbi:MAG: DNA-binding response regulator [Acidobacteria bacterium]|nr:MAG: DNA-binding response regulator [Acidobacteriota bacterium]